MMTEHTKYLDQETVDSIAAKNDIPTNYPLRTVLNDAIGRYYDYIAIAKITPRRKANKKYLKDLNKHASALYEVLSSMDEQVEWWIDSSEKAFRDRWIPEDKKRSNKWNRRLAKDCRELSEITKSLIKNVPEDTGRASLHLDVLIRPLYSVYRDAKKIEAAKPKIWKDRITQKYEGGFLHFVNDCLKHLGIKRSNAALGTYIGRVFEHRKTSQKK